MSEVAIDLANIALTVGALIYVFAWVGGGWR